MKNNKKKKGFTLVELIAVIAILGILAAIIVPRIGGYTASATNAKYLADAKTIANAVEIYNTENLNSGDAISDTTTITELKAILCTGGTSTYGSGVPASASPTAITDIQDGSAKKYVTTWPKDTDLEAIFNVGTSALANAKTLADISSYIQAHN